MKQVDLKRVDPVLLRGLTLLCPEERARICNKARNQKERVIFMRYEATIQALAAVLRHQVYKTDSRRCLLTLKACGELDGPEE